VGRAAVRLLEKAGYEIELVGGFCCGRPAVSKGLLDVGRELAGALVDRLSPAARAGVPIVGLEPSCLTMLVDDNRQLRLADAAQAVAKATTQLESLVADAIESGRIRLRPIHEKVLLHGHCQQKAIFGTAQTARLLRLIPGINLQELDSGCCGMAGSFGYDKDHYDMSKALADRVILKAMSDNPNAILVAAGTSCRAQVEDLAGHHALHPLELVARQVEG
jgi:Fe-S oxidoreductase